MTRTLIRRSVFPAFAAVLLAAFVMRGPVTVVGPIAHEIIAALGTEWSVYGFIAALPIFAFGLCSFPAPAISRRLGTERAALAALAVLCAGALARVSSSLWVYLLGTLGVGAGIAFLNVIMPVVIKSRWPAKTGILIGLYTGVIGFSGSVGGLIGAPTMLAGGSVVWPLGLWALLCALAAFFWLILMKPEDEANLFENKKGEERMSLIELMKTQPLLWVLMLVMGLQSLLIYTVCAWIPAYWAEGGMSTSETGVWLFIYLISGFPASIFTARLFDVCRSDALAGAILSALYLFGLAGWMMGGAWLLPASIAAGASQGAMLSAAFLLMGKRTKNSAAMMAASAFAQGVGYLGAGIGPWLFGFLWEASSSWTSSFVFVAAVIVLWGLSVRATGIFGRF